LFKEYCIIDLSRYKENKFGMRWRTEKEVVTGRGQFACANKKCDERKKLRTWEVNFGYIENHEKKNALIKSKSGKIVSKKASAAGKRAYKLISGWTKAVQQARKQLKVKGFVAVKKGTPLYKLAKDLYRK